MKNCKFNVYGIYQKDSTIMCKILIDCSNKKRVVTLIVTFY